MSTPSPASTPADPAVLADLGRQHGLERALSAQYDVYSSALEAITLLSLAHIAEVTRLAYPAAPLTEQLTSPREPFRRLGDQDIRGLIRSKAGQVDDSPAPRTGAKPMLRRLKSEEVDEIVKAYEAGSTPNELAASFRIHRTTVMANLRRRGVTIWPREVRRR